MECIFCRIAKGEIPSKKVYENELVFCFLDINPCTPGHTLLIPKKHYQFLEEMGKEEVAAIFTEAAELEKKAKSSLGASGANIGINDGKVAGAEVPHVHVHMIPRYAGDNGGAMQSIVRTHVDRSKFDEIAAKLSRIQDTEKNVERKTSYDDFFR